MLYSQSPPLAENEAAQEEPSGRFAPDEYARGASEFGRRPALAPMHALAPLQPRRSLGRRMFRAMSRFAIAVLIGVGATLGWQAYGDMAKEMLAARAPEQAWLLDYLPATKPPAAVAAANPALQLEPLATNLEFVRRSVEQLALKQEQMSRSIAALQAVDEDIRQKVFSPPPAPVPPQPAAAIPPPKPAPPKPPAAAAPSPRPASSNGPVSLLPR